MLKDAIDSFDSAIKLNPNYSEAYNNKGNAYKSMGELKHANECYSAALKLNPNYVEALSNKANVLTELGDLDAALTLYDMAKSLDNQYIDAQFNSSFALLNNGRMDEGLYANELRWKTKKFIEQKRRFRQPMLDKTVSNNGDKLLLWSEQGVGDTLNWSARLPYLQKNGFQCTVECPEKLIPLLARSFPDVKFDQLSSFPDEDRKDFDVHLPLGSIHYYTQKYYKPKMDKTLI